MESLSITILSHDYPSASDWHKAAFVQARADIYADWGHSVEIQSREHRSPPNPFPDVVAVHYPLPEFNIPLATGYMHRGIPVVAFLHGAEAIRTPYKSWLWDLRVRLSVGRFVRKCSAVVTSSQWMRKEARAYLGIDSLVIPNPVDPDLFPLITRRETMGRRGLCLRGPDPKYGTDLIEEVADVVNLPPIFQRKDLSFLLSDFTFFVAPSRLEGQGLMACEAAATGMPVVSTRVGGIPEFLDADLHYLASTPTRDAILKEIGRVPEYVSPELSRRIRDSIMSKCEPSATVQRDIDLFQTVMAGMSP